MVLVYLLARLPTPDRLQPSQEAERRPILCLFIQLISQPRPLPARIPRTAGPTPQTVEQKSGIPRYPQHDSNTLETPGILQSGYHRLGGAVLCHGGRCHSAAAAICLQVYVANPWDKLPNLLLQPIYLNSDRTHHSRT